VEVDEAVIHIVGDGFVEFLVFFILNGGFGLLPKGAGGVDLLLDPFGFALSLFLVFGFS
jgi:hypothetical protein